MKKKLKKNQALTVSFNMETIPAGELASDVLIKQEIECLAEETCVPDLAKQKLQADMEPLRSIKTKEDPYSNDVEAHAVQVFPPVPQTDAYIKTELTLDEEFIDEGNDTDSVSCAEASQQAALAVNNEPRTRVATADHSVTCKVCRNIYPGELIETHMRQKHGTKVYKCPFCPRVCLHKTTYEKHISIHSENRPRPYVCEQCGFKFLAESSLKNHINAKHTKDRKPEFDCKFCEKKFYSREGWNYHMRTHTVKTARCEVCGLHLLDDEGLKKHVLNKHAFFKCELCDRLFIGKLSFDRHMLTHTTKTVSCQLCETRFIREQGLRKHMLRKHTAKTQHQFTPEPQTANDCVEIKEEFISGEEFLEEGYEHDR